MKSKIISFSFLLFLTPSLTKAQDWEFVGLDSMAIKQLYVSGDSIWAGTAHRVGNQDRFGLYKSINGGNTWTRLDDTLGIGNIYSFFIDEENTNNIWIIKGYNAYGTGIFYKTTNGGENWSYAQNVTQNVIQWFDISPFNKNEIYFIDESYAPGGILNTLHKSTNGGENWQTLGPFPSSSHGSALTFTFDLTDSMHLYVTVDTQFDQYLYKSTNKGNSWLYISEPPAIERELRTDPILSNRIFIFPGYFLAEDGGYNWTIADSGLSDINSYLTLYIDPIDKTTFYNLRKDGLFTSNNNPIFWQLEVGTDTLPLNLGSQGFLYEDIAPLRNIFIDTSTKVIYLGTARGIYKKNLVTEVETNWDNHPSEFTLHQNYPNPFNPITTISYQIPENCLVSLRVYDVLGNEIATLVNEEKPQGIYKISFDATGLTSGIYFFRLRAGAFTETKKMVLTK